MDDKYKDYLSYLEFLHRIGRRVGYKSEAPSESMKMTREEQIKLSGLLMIEAGDLMPYRENIYKTEMDEMMVNNNEQTRAEFVRGVQETWIDYFYPEIESLLGKITKAEATYE